jgi:FkbM family methyltransferase
MKMDLRLRSFARGLAGRGFNRFVRTGFVRTIHRVLSRRDQEWAALCASERGGRLAFSQDCLSQEGEDLILNRIFDGRETGFFVDVGAYHPVRYSNTYILYRRGWRGINIDATPGSITNFNMVRPEDINIEALISSDEGESTFYMFDEGALNTASRDVAAKRRTNDPNYRSIGTAVVHRRRLSSILDEHLPVDTVIDFIDIDVEGSEIDVLRSNDWKRYRPRVVLLEQLETTIDKMPHHESTIFLKSVGYTPAYKLFNTSIFTDEARIGK